MSKIELNMKTRFYFCSAAPLCKQAPAMVSEMAASWTRMPLLLAVLQMVVS